MKNEIKQEMIDRYKKYIDNKKNLDAKYILLKSGQESEILNISDFNKYSSAVLGNRIIFRKVIRLTEGIEYTNELLIELYKIHEFLINDKTENLADVRGYLINRYINIGYDLIHDIRCMCDSIVMLTCILNEEKIITSGKNKYGRYSEYKDLFDLVSTVDNVSKHRFYFDEVQAINTRHLSVYYIDCQNDQLPKVEDIKEVNIEFIVKSFNGLFDSFLKEINTLNKNKRIED